MDTEETLQRLQERLQILEDRAEIQALMNVYCTTADAKEWDAWKLLWIEDAIFEFAGYGVIQGRDAFTDAIDKAEKPYQGMHHSNFNLQVEFDREDHATGTAMCLFGAVPDLSKPSTCFVFGGPYTMEYVRTPEGWRLSKMLLVMIWNLGDPSLDVFT